VHRIIHIVNIIKTINKLDISGLSGYYNNDFTDIYKIIILLSLDKLIVKDPFLR
jgi:hypothetical protein